MVATLIAPQPPQGRQGPAQPSPALGDALNVGYRYLEVKCLGCNTHQTVALDIVRRPKATPIHELERYIRLRMKSAAEWKAYCRSGKKPHDIPARPDLVYANTGWAGLNDWMGTGTVSPSVVRKRPFKEARAFVRGLGLKSANEWDTYCRSGKKPNDIPAEPRHYEGTGWAGFQDWLGTAEPRLFNEARAFARSLNLKSGTEWFIYCKSGKKPEDIPTSPRQMYAEAGWVSMGDRLGTGTVAPRLRQYRSFKEARAFARNLGLNSGAEWKNYCRSGEKPEDIPSKPDNGYADQGWAGMADWLGYVRSGRRNETRPKKRTGEAPPSAAEAPSSSLFSTRG